MKNVITTIIEITEFQIRLFRCATSRGRKLLSCCAIAPLTQNNADQDIVKFLRKNPDLKDVPSEEIALVIPRKSAILKQLRLPTHNDAEIKKMLSLQLGSQIPYALEDVVYDYVVLEQEPSGYVHVLVTVVHKEVSSRYMKCCARAKLSLGRMVLSSWGLLGWLSYQNHQKNGIKENNGIIVDISSSSTELCFCAGEKLYFSRSLNFGVKEFTDDKFSFFIKQLKLSLETFKKGKMGPKMKNIFLLGSHKAIFSLKELLEQELRLPVAIYSSFENIVCAKNASLTEITRQRGASFAVCLGMLLNGAEQYGNLIPREVSQRKHQKLLDLERVKFVLLVLLGCFLALTSFTVERNALQQIESQIDKKIAATRPLMQSLQKKEKAVAELSSVIQGRLYIPEMVYSIHKIVPEGLILNSLSIDNAGNVVISGDAVSSALVQNFQNDLVQEKGFSDVRLQYATKRKLYRKEVTNYKIVLKALSPQKKDLP